MKIENPGAWETYLGVTDPSGVFSKYGIVGQPQPTGDHVTFGGRDQRTCTLYKGDTAKGYVQVAIAEVSNGIYFVGIKK